MIISEIPQNTPEWLAERAGIPTSSSFDMIVTTLGKPSKQRQKYMYALAAERITGVKTEHHQSQAMLNGIECEAEARDMYEFITGNEVKQVGVCFPDERRLCGSSPDGLVGEDGALEIKCPLSHTHVEYLFKGTLPTTYFAQIQGQLFVTGRKWVDFMSYFPNLRPLIIRIKPDITFFKALEVELTLFIEELKELTKKLGGK